MVVVLLSIIFLFSSCSTHSVYSDRPDFAMYERIARENHRHFAKMGLTLYGFGDSAIGPSSVSYRTSRYRFTSVEEAHPFFRSFVTTFMKPFNEEKKLRPYMRNYPLTAEDFELSISFFKNDQFDILLKPYIDYICLCRGKVFYYVSVLDPTKKYHPYTSELIHVESFE